MLTSSPAKPGYDLTMECLALLPLFPLGVPLTLLAGDLGLPTQGDVRDLFPDLKKMGVDVKVWTTDEGRMAAVTSETWGTAKRLATMYVERS